MDRKERPRRGLRLAKRSELLHQMLVQSTLDEFCLKRILFGVDYTVA
jgi:hypothetical protein